jgi:hypothetical protein
MPLSSCRTRIEHHGSLGKNMKAEPSVDYDSLMRANLHRVFGEADAQKRLLAIRSLYAADAVLNEPHASARGHIEINDAVSALLAGLPGGFVFQPIGPAQGHHGIGILLWGSGPIQGPFAVTGMDVAHFQGGFIHSLFVFLNPPTAPEAPFNR